MSNLPKPRQLARPSSREVVERAIDASKDGRKHTWAYYQSKWWKDRK